MSLFPRHLCRGQTIAIHVRVSPGPTCFPYVRATIHDPHGKTLFEDARQLSASIPAPAKDEPVERRIAQGLCESPPLLFVAQHLRESDESRAELVGLLQDIRHSTHWYWRWTVPDAAALGRYEVDTAAWVDGTRYGSKTAALDKFFVERLSLESCEQVHGERVARIRNHSPEPTQARLHEYGKANGTISCAVRPIELAGASSTDVVVRSEHSMLSYAEDSGSLWLHGEDDPVYVRNQTFASMVSRDESIVVTSTLIDKSFTLRGPACIIWTETEGVMRRSKLEPFGAGALDALLDAGLLCEVSTDRKRR